jgi:hypothetical protein
MRSLGALLTAVFLLAAPAALAASIDLADLSCKQFTDYNKDNTSIILTWLDGYYLGQGNSPVIDFDRMGENGKKLEQYCSDHPTDSVKSGAASVMAK